LSALSAPAGLRPSARVAWQLLDGEAILIDLAGGGALGLNASGSFLWARLADHDPDQLVAALCREFDVTVAAAQADVTGFLQLLELRGFAEPR